MAIGDLDYRFEELPVRIDDGLAWFWGLAVLKHDRGGDFFVSSVFLDGPGDGVELDRSGSVLAQRLNAAISDAIYSCPYASRAWADHFEREQADAA